jgi:hypothetical protein
MLLAVPSVHATQNIALTKVMPRRLSNMPQQTESIEPWLNNNWPLFITTTYQSPTTLN